MLVLEYVIKGEADNLGELGQKLKAHQVIAMNNLKEIEALESICFDKKVKVCGKGKKAKKGLVIEANYRGLKIE